MTYVQLIHNLTTTTVRLEVLDSNSLRTLARLMCDYQVIHNPNTDSQYGFYTTPGSSGNGPIELHLLGFQEILMASDSIWKTRARPIIYNNATKVCSTYLG